MQRRSGLSIGQLAQRCGIGVETIRFYERRGLLDQPPRPASGYRRYPAAAVDRIFFLKRAKDLGFSLTEIRELISLRDRRTEGCESVLERSKKKIEEIEERISALETLRRDLLALVATCDGQVPLDRCRILQALSAEEGKAPNPRRSDHE
ncbi:MAG: MerR family DNA-binding protein [Polyangiaceae bacterium]|jgi:Hg(II)-responsive transcriptional regulator|nr:MerR family DNA-binding protein [Polyangiaceae bacterium]